MEKLICFLRFYVKDQETCDALKKIVRRAVIAMHDPNVSISFLINTYIHLKKEFKDQISEITKDLLYHNISFSVTVAYGAGHAYFDILEEAISTTSLSKKERAIFLLDADQYDISDPLIIKRLLQLRKEVIQNNAIIGVAQRNKILLANTKELEIAREIEELFHAYFIRNKFFNTSSKAELSKIKSPKGYQALGDPVPGCYCINIRHPRFFKFLSHIQQDLLVADLSKYSGDPYIIMQASQYGNIITRYVPIIDNPPSGFSLETITDKHRNLAATSIGKQYMKAVLSTRAKEALCQYYSEKEVEQVLNLIKKGFQSIMKKR